MKKKILITLLVVVTLVIGAVIILKKQSDQFQADADRARLEHLVYWTGLFEAYHAKTGHYPLQDRLTGDKPGLVRIATRDQQKYFDPQSPKYLARDDNNPGGTYFQEFPVKDLVRELSAGLGRKIDEKYEIQSHPYLVPLYYAYFPTREGYLMWVSCVSCGVTNISTMLMDGSVATVNIASPAMAPKVEKALTRDAMLAHPTFQRWMAVPYAKEGFVRARENAYLHDSDDR